MQLHVMCMYAVHMYRDIAKQFKITVLRQNHKFYGQCCKGDIILTKACLNNMLRKSCEKSVTCTNVST